jgi:RNA-directed DNA polymerase
MDKQGEEDLWQRYGAQRGVWTEKMLMALDRGVKGNVWFSLIDKIYATGALALAWEQVQFNAGACGVDCITVKHFAKDSPSRLLAVKEYLREGIYRPKPVKRVMIPKLGSNEKRPLGIPTVTDRVVQTAARMVVEPIFEREFAEHSYGFRPGRGCKDALRRVDQLLRSGLTYVVEVDIKGYFDSIPHQRLMALVAERIADQRVLGLIEQFLKQDIVTPEGKIEAPTQGTPQGGVISPLLANIYLNPLDHLMRQKGHEMVRYADDMVILCRTAEEAASVLDSLREWMAQAELSLHPEKTRSVNTADRGSHFDFLGYRFYTSKAKGQRSRLIRPKSGKKLRETLKPHLRRNSGRSMDAIIAMITPTVRGFYAYFRHASERSLCEVDKWIRGRLRSILRRRAKLRGRGRGLDHSRWPNCYFTALGLFSLQDAQRSEIVSLPNAAKC